MEGSGNRESVKVSLRKKHVFVIEKYVEGVKQGQKLAPDLVESIMKLTDIVKEELQRKTMNMHQFIPKITKLWVW